VTHWIAAVAIVVMTGSGLQIFNAYPRFRPRGGAPWPLWPWEGMPAPKWATFGGWLAGGRWWHFAMMWVLVVNGLVYLAWVYLHGEWRDLVPRRGDPRDAWRWSSSTSAAAGSPAPGQAQRAAEARLLLASVLTAWWCLTGIAIWKPVSLGWLTALFGGYAWARWWHFAAMLAVVALAAGHVFMVFAVDPYAIRSMTTGGYDPALSPEARNARPFHHLLPRYRDWRRRHVEHDDGPAAAEIAP
jgi:thiosulfate reductase cytochrome b subunit